MVTGKWTWTYSHKHIMLLVVLLGFTVVSVSAAADYVVIVNKGVPANSLSKDDVKGMFLGEKSKWDDGNPVKVVVLEEGNAHKAFLQDVVGKTGSQFDSHWKKLIFTGKGSPPKSFNEQSKLLEFVAGQAGAIGYIAAGQAGGSVKVISIK